MIPSINQCFDLVTCNMLLCNFVFSQSYNGRLMFVCCVAGVPDWGGMGLLQVPHSV